jgi:major type 1 subunit fimbrin (pilin)
MKTRLLALAIAIAPTFAFAQASNNTINFQGEVTDQTCQVTINGNAANPTVLLPTVPSSQLASAGDTTGETSFQIAVSGCSPMSADQSIKTVFVGNQVTAAGNLGNTGTATNVALQLFDPAASSSPFNLSSVSGYAAPGLKLLQGATSASYNYGVRYISETGSATPGSVLGSVQYAVSYQ